MSQDTKTGKKRALVVAVSDYANVSKDKQLPFCKKDGMEMAKALESIGFEIKDQHKLIGNVTKVAIEDAIDDFFTDESIKRKDVLLFYFSGHGIPESNGDHYIASSEIIPDKPWKGGFSFEELEKFIGRTNADSKVIILDCCYSGSASLGGKGGENDSVTAGVAAVNNKIKSASGKVILAACKGVQEAFGTETLGHSAFTYYLLQGLQNYKDSVDKNGNITPEGLSNYVIDKIQALPRKTRPKQDPIRKVESAGDIILASYPQFAKPQQKNEIFESLVDSDKLEEDERKTGHLMLDQETSQELELPPRKLAYIQGKVVEGNSYFLCKNYQEAIGCYDKALEIEQNYVKALFNKGAALMSLYKYEEAILCFDKILEIEPKNGTTLFTKGRALVYLGRGEEGTKCYDRALGLLSDEADDLCKQGKDWLDFGSSAPALKYFDEALEIKPDHVFALYGKGVALAQLGKYEDAIKWYDKALEIKPDNVNILINKGNALDHSGKYEEAKMCCNEVLKTDPDNVDAIELKKALENKSEN